MSENVGSVGCQLHTQIECAGRLARIEQLLEDYTSHACEKFRQHAEVLTAHEARIVGVERWHQWFLGGVAVVGGGLALLWRWMINHLEIRI